MSERPIKISFTLDAKDTAYFRSRFRKAKRAVRDQDSADIIHHAQNMVKAVKKVRNTPRFVLEAIESIDDLVQLIEDEYYKAPKAVVNKVLAALAYFSNPDDLIPDEIPVLGFLDDAIMIKFVEQEFKNELVAYRKFRKFHRGAEQRPWTQIASARLPGRLEVQRKKLRAEVERKDQAIAAKSGIRL